MPTISINHKDLERLLGDRVTPDRLDSLLAGVKGELKEFAQTAGEIKIELSDSNRPDLWCVEGIARQIRCGMEKRPARYTFTDSKKGRPRYQIRVAPEMREIRPFIGGCVARGVPMDEAVLDQIIQTQEKLSDIFGRKRHTLSIGYYRLAQIAFPVSYRSVGPDEVRFRPLGEERLMTPREILQSQGHPIRIFAGLPRSLSDLCRLEGSDPLVSTHHQQSRSRRGRAGRPGSARRGDGDRSSDADPHRQHSGGKPP